LTRFYHPLSSLHPSSFPPPFLIAAVPIALLLLFFSGTAELASCDPNVSPKSFRAGSATVLKVPPRAALPLPPSSMNLSSCLAAPLVLVWMVWPTEAAIRPAWVVRSASASWWLVVSLDPYCIAWVAPPLSAIPLSLFCVIREKVRGGPSNLLRRRPHPALINLSRPLPHRARKPPQPLTQRTHGIPLEIVHPRHPFLLLFPALLNPRRHTPKPSVLPALARRYPLWPRLIRVAHPREVCFVNFLPARHAAAPCRTLLFPPHFPFRHPHELPPFSLASQPLSPLLPNFAPIPLRQHLGRRRHFPQPPWMLALPEGAKGGIAA